MEVPSQKRNVFVRGSPIGQQQHELGSALTGADGATATGACGVMAMAGLAGMLASGGSVLLLARGPDGVGSALRRIGDGLASSSRRPALPTTAFFEIPIRRPISAVECPSDHRRLSSRIASWFQIIDISP